MLGAFDASGLRMTLDMALERAHFEVGIDLDAGRIRNGKRGSQI